MSNNYKCNMDCYNCIFDDCINDGNPTAKEQYQSDIRDLKYESKINSHSVVHSKKRRKFMRFNEVK